MQLGEEDQQGGSAGKDALTKPEELSLVLGTHLVKGKERTDFCELSSDSPKSARDFCKGTSGMLPQLIN